ncbi:MAG: DUF4347 domain-containing protein, partial [Gammaproteobacteria bacterium]|nr:DUF4347 domain-containing protein [Gammaproteobacteria bacterium]
MWVKTLLNKKIKFSNTSLLFEELEPRLLLSADGLAVITEANIATSQELILGDNEIKALIVQDHTEQSPPVIKAKQHSTELVIIDSRVPNFQQLHNDIIRAQQQGRDINVLVLDAHRDGLEQISEALSKYNQLDAVHIVSHGSDGQLQLGATQLNKNTLRDRADDISSWKDTFTEGGDLLIYGCNLADTADGKSLVDAISYLTLTDVAASDDLTGNTLLGGDWNLEYQAGDIETSVAFSDNVQQHWQGTLNTAPVITNNDTAINYTENEPATILFANATVLDSDGLDYHDGTLTVSFAA